MNKRLRQMLSSNELHSIFIRNCDNAILLSETGRTYVINGNAFINVDYYELSRSEYYTEVSKDNASNLIIVTY